MFPTPATTSEAAACAVFLRDHPGSAVLSGAGLSTESGIPDYRGPDGLRRVTPMQHGEFVASAAARQRYWARSYLGWGRFSAAAPNQGHRAIARLQRADRLGPVITQNVDGLHQQAGSRDVVDLHGSLAEVVCLQCGVRVERVEFQRTLAAANPGFGVSGAEARPDGSRVSSQIRPDGDVVIPDEEVLGFVVPGCPGCGVDLLKPDVVFFGASVPPERVARCADLVAAAPALVVLGSSLAVMSGFRFVRQAVSLGRPVLLATASPTRADELATVRLWSPLGGLLAATATLLIPGPGVVTTPA